MPPFRRKAPAFVASLVMAAALVGCGARVSDEQRASAAGGLSGQAASSGRVVGDAGAGGVESGAEADATATTVAGASGDGTSGGDASTATTAPPGGNGGATDVGVTPDTINLGSVVTMSGPVPGLFSGAAVGTQAFLAYQNSQGGVFGRKLKLDVRDDQFDTGQNRAQTIDAIKKTFALVGGFSLYDDAAVAEIDKAGIPVIQVPLAPGLQQSPMNFAVAPVQRGTPSGPWVLLKEKFPGAIGAIGGLYSDIPAAKDNFLNIKNATQGLGYRWAYERGFQATETDFTADVVRMRQAGVKLVFTNADVKSIARIGKAMAQQGFKPDAFVSFGPGYDATLAALGGDAVEGLLNVTTQAMYMGEDSGSIPEVKLFNEWLQRVKPGYKPDLFAAYGWGSARLFVQALQAAGPQATRASLLTALKKIDSFTGNGMFPESGPASKRPAVCYIVVTVKGGKFQRWESPPANFRCDNSTFVYRT